MTTELETIAKQVSLLNRLIELLMVEANVSQGFAKIKEWNCNPRLTGRTGFNREAWSDELVRVARDMIGTQSKFDTNYFKDSEAMMCICMDSIERLINYTLKAIWINNKGELVYCLEAILNKYGRTLVE